jgi:hypothetical protein
MQVLLYSRFGTIQGVNNKLTTHASRKTGYSFALWGGGDLQTALVSARHKTDIVAKWERQLCPFLLQNRSCNGSKRHILGGRIKMALNVNPESDHWVCQEQTTLQVCSSYHNYCPIMGEEGMSLI